MSRSNDLLAYLSQRGGPVRLHLGCGGERWRDFVNVDLHPSDASIRDSSRSPCRADVWADMRSLALPDEYIDEIFTAHTLEHFTRWEAVAMLRDWHRMLKCRGRLVIETPSFWGCVTWLFHPSRRKRDLALSQFYGNQWDRIDFETHRYVWRARELRSILLDEIGYSGVRVSRRTWTHHPGRDMQIVAEK